MLPRRAITPSTVYTTLHDAPLGGILSARAIYCYCPGGRVIVCEVIAQAKDAELKSDYVSGFFSLSS